MRPLIKKGMWIKYRMGREIKEAEVFHSRMLNVWIKDHRGKVIRIHRKYHKVEIIEKPEKERGGGKKPSTDLDDLLKKVKKKSKKKGSSS